MTGQQSDWQQRYANARPAGAAFLAAGHRRLIRAVFGVMVVLSIGLVVWTAHDGGRLVSPVINVLVFSSQLYLWGWNIPAQIDAWAARQRADADERPNDVTTP